MISHLTLPYNWMDCVNPETCEENIHLQDTAENLNSYPLPWLEELIGNCAILIKKDDTGATVTETIKLYDTNGELHSRNNQPAVIHHHNHAPGTPDHSYSGWYRHGKYHRENGPAMERTDGHKAWCLNGDKHREDGPAIEYPDGKKAWFHRGKYHRENGPAREWADGRKEWYQHGQKHRMDGPAVIQADGSQEWWINNVQQPPPETHKEGAK